jgi:hypothetical protein
MTLKEQLMQAIEEASDPVLVEVLDFLQFLQAKQAEDAADIQAARESLATVSTEGTVSWETLRADVGL